MSEEFTLKYRLYVARVWVRDFDRAVSFYEKKIGLSVLFRSDELGWAQLDTGEAQLAIERFEPENKDGEELDELHAGLVGRIVGVSLAVEDIEKTVDTLTARGVEFLRPPTKMPWGGVLADLKDPEGNVITLLESAAS